MKRIIALLFTMSIIILSFTIPSNVNAESKSSSAWKEWSSKIDVDIDKEWVIKFNDEIDEKSLYENMYVLRERDNKRMNIVYPLVDQYDKKTVRLYLSKLYDFGETYYLYISKNVKSVNGTPLKEPVKMKFQTVNPDIINTLEQDGIKFEVMLNTKDSQKNNKLYVKVKATNVSEYDIPYISYNGCDIGLHAHIQTESDTGQVKVGSNWESSLIACGEVVEEYFLEPGETIERLEVLYPPNEELKDNDFVKVTFQKNILTGSDSFTTIEIPIAIFNLSPTSQVVNILEKDLERAIRKKLHKPTGYVTVADMHSINELKVSGRISWGGISDISPLKYAKNLTKLELPINSINDISALSGLTKLEYLDLQGQGAGIVDITALSSLTNLEHLNLSNSLDQHSDVDLSALSRLTNLKYLNLGDNPSISNNIDISSLSGLTNLKTLDLGRSSIRDISALNDLINLETLNLSGNSINDIGSLNGLTKLETLDLDDSSISDISSLSGLTNLKTLNLSGNPINDISALNGLTKLETLDLRVINGGSQLSDISALSGLTNLKELYLGGSNELSDISPLSKLTNLKTLILWNNYVSDISALSGLTNLETLDLSSYALNLESKKVIEHLRANGVIIMVR